MFVVLDIDPWMTTVWSPTGYKLGNEGANRVPVPRVVYLGYFVRPWVLRDKKCTSKLKRLLQNRKGYFKAEKAPPGSNIISDSSYLFRTFPLCWKLEWFNHFEIIRHVYWFAYCFIVWFILSMRNGVRAR